MPDQAGRTLVKGADGTLYRLSMTDPPEPVAAGLAQAISAALPTIEGILEERFLQEISNVVASCHQTIKIVIPEVDIPIG